MSRLSLENPVFVVYAIAASIMALKIMGQGWMTVYRMLKSDSGLASPEDLRPGLINKNPREEQLELNDYVDRSRRMHRNDLENIPAFLAIGLIFVTIDPSLLVAIPAHGVRVLLFDAPVNNVQLMQELLGIERGNGKLESLVALQEVRDRALLGAHARRLPGLLADLVLVAREVVGESLAIPQQSASPELPAE